MEGGGREGGEGKGRERGDREGKRREGEGGIGGEGKGGKRGRRLVITCFKIASCDCCNCLLFATIWVLGVQHLDVVKILGCLLQQGEV